MIKLKNCPICKTKDWVNLNYLRDHKFWQDQDYIELDEKVEMKICKNCAFVTYDYIELDKLQKNYDRQRPVVQAMNLITMNRKNEYHKTFLGSKDEFHGLFNCTPLPQFKCLDVGCAQGTFLDLLCKYYFVDRKRLYGTEWSKAFRDFGEEYGLDNLTQEIDKSIKYDFISYYHVLEHCQHPDKELEMVRDILTDEGYLYIGIPTWFEKLEMDSGGDIVNFEDLFHLNHINCFTKQSLRNLLYVQGFEIVKEAEHIYGYTVLCKKAPKLSIEEGVKKGNWKETKKIIENQKEAIHLLQTKQYDKAIELVPNFPDAYIYKSLQKDNLKDLNVQLAILDEGLKHTPDCMRLLLQKAKIYFQWDENTPEKQNYYSNNIKRAEELFKKVLKYKSGNEDIYYFLSMIEAKYKGNHDKAVDYMKKCLEINPSKFIECWGIIATIYKDKGECPKEN